MLNNLGAAIILTDFKNVTTLDSDKRGVFKVHQYIRNIVDGALFKVHGYIL